MRRKTETVTKMSKCPKSLLLSCLMILALLSACGSGQQMKGDLSGNSEISFPKQPVEEVHPGKDLAQTEVPNLEPDVSTGGKGGSHAEMPLPSETDGQVQEMSPSENKMTPSTDEPAVPSLQETPDIAPESAPEDLTEENTENEKENTAMKMNIQVGASTFTATLEDNAAVDALVEMMKDGPLSIRMSDYGGFEKVGALGTSLPASNSQITTQTGDIVLYQGNQIVVFYGTNSWNYTYLGKIDDLTGWAEALGDGDVSVMFSLGG